MTKQSYGIIVAGVAGAGKSTVGARLSENLKCKYYDANDLHPPENIKKMAAGIPLTDEDRQPWLVSVRGLIESLLSSGGRGVIECSALKSAYRDYLIGSCTNVFLVFLDVSFEVAYERVATRKGHYFGPDLINSQFEALDLPPKRYRFDATLSPEEIVDEIRQRYQLEFNSE